jgi:hypothetical protein
VSGLIREASRGVEHRTAQLPEPEYASTCVRGVSKPRSIIPVPLRTQSGLSTPYRRNKTSQSRVTPPSTLVVVSQFNPPNNFDGQPPKDASSLQEEQTVNYLLVGDYA